MAANGNLIFQDTNKATFVGANSNVVIDTVHASFGVGVDVNGPTSNLHVVGNAYVTSNLEVGTANLFVDTVNSRVGIGTTDPNSLLELSSATGSATITPTELRLSTTTNAGDWDTTNPWGKISFYSHDTSNGGPQVRGAIGMSVLESFGGYGRLGLFTENSGTLSERVSITHAGNVGIGTTNPQDVTHIWKNGSNDAHGLLIEQNNSGTGSATLKFGVAHASESTAGLSKAGIFFKRAASNGRGDLLFCMDNADDTNDVDTSNHALTIYRDGKVGIGVTNPDEKLEVVQGQSIKLSGNQNDGTAKLYIDRVGDATWGSTGLYDAFRFFETRNSSASEHFNAVKIGASGIAIGYDPPLYTRAGVDSLLCSGRVGIGNTTPISPLDVRINDGVSSVNWISGAFGPATGSVSRVVVGSYNNSPIIGGHNSTLTGWDKLVINPTNQGYVGVGTFTPLRKLHVEPGLMVSNNATISGLLVDNSAQSNAADQFSYILNGPRPGTASGGAVHFINSSLRAIDGPASSYVIRNDSGPLVIGSNTTGTTTINGTGALIRSNGDASTMNFGPNASFASTLVVGATTGGALGSDAAAVVTTNGNLHLDAGDNRSTYLNFYSGGSVIFGNGASGSAGVMTANGDMGLGSGATTPVSRLHIKQSADSAVGCINIEKVNSTARWAIYMTNGSDLYFNYQGTMKGFIHWNINGTRMNFTGQHRTFIKDVPFSQAGDLEGLIVSADQNNYIKMSDGVETGSNAITINESLPVVSLSTKVNDKKCFGVISASEDPEKRTEIHGNFESSLVKELGDTRVYINSVGEGAIWVTDINGPLESGDYITTSNVAGYGQKQNSEFLANYTVAKITMDCDFEPVTQPVQIIRKELSNVNYWVNTTYENVSYEEYSNLTEENRRTITETVYTNEYGQITIGDYSNLESNIQSTYSELTQTLYQKIITDESKTEQEGYELEVRNELVNVLDEHSQIQWEDDPSGATEKAYKIRYLDADGVETDEASTVHKAAFVGCTYHCG